MQRLSEVAQRLREVREAHQRFLALYAVEVALVDPGIERLTADAMDGDGSADGNPDMPHWRPESHDAGPASFGWQ